ncbi:hypothetical protein THIAE_05800 [Thiomicrospira aerophila AL3]|uniref:Uncharacterized protein n=1 Tax=Thiomicrospira aerophila AL3 TaxID=717772 RepID=W0DZI7_9GAMM|nr:hypothetical protein [Thiomicrospira aerophila]AHF02261.1 hypothetical protein THIAE_05800 [Thiomicrospira aerophila AL3]
MENKKDPVLCGPSFKSLHINNNTPISINGNNSFAILWARCFNIAKQGLLLGYEYNDVFRAVALVAHCERQTLHLLDAHMIALESMRYAAREVRA